MPNIRKTFNFRDGVQVDDDDLVVRGGQVGIGITIPTHTLDVNGDIRAVGLVTSENHFVSGISTIIELRVGSNIIASASSGIITATSFYGNGATLSNLPTSQWIDVDIGLGFTSIYSSGNVGVSTSDPRNTFQIGQNPNSGGRGVGFNSTGDMRASGIVTAYAFVGFGTNITNLNADNITNGTISNTYLPIIDNQKLPANINVSGFITAISGFSGNLIGTVTGRLVGIADSASSLTGVPSIVVGIITATKIIADSIEVIRDPVGITTIANILYVGTGGTGFSALSSGNIGVGTTNPTAEIQVRKNGTTVVEVISNTGEARINIGRSIGLGNSSTVLRFGSGPGAFEILNRSTGAFNQYLHAGGSGIGTGNFNWIYGQNNIELMTLTYGGALGIGKTNPDNTLHIVGTSTVTATAYFGENIQVSGNISFGPEQNRIILGGSGGVLDNINLNSTSGITTISQLNVIGASRIGIATTNPIVGLDAKISTGLFNQIGISTAISEFPVKLLVNGKSSFSNSVGIGTTAPLSQINDPMNGSLDAGLLQIFGQTNIYNNRLIMYGISAIGINSALPIGPIDLRFARITPFLRGVFYPPILTNTERSAITPNYVADGAIIYNSTSSRHEGYDGKTFTWNVLGGQSITLGTAKNYDFNGFNNNWFLDFINIPSSAKRITVMFREVGTNGSMSPLIQLGTSSGIVDSGYLGSSSVIGSGSSTVNISSGFLAVASTYWESTGVLHGSVTFSLISGSTWIASGVTGRSDSPQTYTIAGTITLPSTLDRIRVTTDNVDEVFNNGSVNIMYE